MAYATPSMLHTAANDALTTPLQHGTSHETGLLRVLSSGLKAPSASAERKCRNLRARASGSWEGTVQVDVQYFVYLEKEWPPPFTDGGFLLTPRLMH